MDYLNIVSTLFLCLYKDIIGFDELHDPTTKCSSRGHLTVPILSNNISIFSSVRRDDLETYKKAEPDWASIIPLYDSLVMADIAEKPSGVAWVAWIYLQRENFCRCLCAK